VNSRKAIPLLDIIDGNVPDAPPMESGHWTSNTSFSLMATVFEWKRLPSEFGLCAPEEDLTLMVAYMATKSDMEAFDRALLKQE
jgi:hypothetical protein